MAIHSSLAVLTALLASFIIVASNAEAWSLSGAHLRGLTASQRAILAGRLAAAAGGAAEQLPHVRHLLQGKGKAPAEKLPAPAPAPEAELDIIIDLPPGLEPQNLTPAEEEQLIGTALGIAAAIDTIDGLFAPAPAVDGQPA